MLFWAKTCKIIASQSIYALIKGKYSAISNLGIQNVSTPLSSTSSFFPLKLPQLWVDCREFSLTAE